MDEPSARMLTSLNQPGGAVAQLGARLDGIEEVVGSNPIGSTNFLLSTLARSENNFHGELVQALVGQAMGHDFRLVEGVRDQRLRALF
jgi:hypothetical protein